MNLCPVCGEYHNLCQMLGTMANPHKPGTAESPTHVYVGEWFEHDTSFGSKRIDLLMFNKRKSEQKFQLFSAIGLSVNACWMPLVGFKFYKEIRK